MQHNRDDRVEAFTDRMYGGSHSFHYQAQVTIPGRYTAPPTTAEEMYSPEVFGRSDSVTVIVEA